MRQTSVFANAMFVLGPFVLTAIAVAAMDPLLATIATVTFYLVGTLMLVISKRSLLRQGESSSLASGRLEDTNRRRYFYGYGMITIGILFNLALLRLII